MTCPNCASRRANKVGDIWVRHEDEEFNPVFNIAPKGTDIFVMWQSIGGNGKWYSLVWKPDTDTKHIVGPGCDRV